MECLATEPLFCLKSCLRLHLTPTYQIRKLRLSSHKWKITVKLGRKLGSLSPMLQWGSYSSPNWKLHLYIRFAWIFLMSKRPDLCKAARCIHGPLWQKLALSVSFCLCKLQNQKSRSFQPSAVMLLFRVMQLSTCAISILHCPHLSPLWGLGACGRLQGWHGFGIHNNHICASHLTFDTFDTQGAHSLSVPSVTMHL